MLGSNTSFKVVLHNASFKIKIKNDLHVPLLLRVCIYKILINNHRISYIVGGMFNYQNISMIKG